MNQSMHIHPDSETLAEAAARLIVDILGGAVTSRGRASLVLTGGTTPRRTYEILSARHSESLDWQHVDFFWGDERFVHPDSSDSNYGMAAEALLNHVRSGRDFPIPTTLETPREAAAAYEDTILEYFAGREASFDLTLLGLGADAHVASLFPGAPELEEMERLVVPTVAPEGSPVRDRISLTFPILNASRTVLFIVSGEKKQEAVHRAMNGTSDTPAGRVQARDQTIWYVDEAAAGTSAGASSLSRISPE